MAASSRACCRECDHPCHQQKLNMCPSPSFERASPTSFCTPCLRHFSLSCSVPFSSRMVSVSRSVASLSFGCWVSPCSVVSSAPPSTPSSGPISSSAMFRKTPCFRLWMSSTAVLYIVPLITHFAIQLRILSFYPPTLASCRKRVAISVLPSVMKVARLTTISVTLSNSASAYHSDGFGVTVSRSTNDVSNLLTLIFQLVDCLYASFFLLWRFCHLGRRDNELMSKKANPALRWSKQIMFAIAFGYVLLPFMHWHWSFPELCIYPPTTWASCLLRTSTSSIRRCLGFVDQCLQVERRSLHERSCPRQRCLAGLRDANDPFATGPTTRDSRHIPALSLS